MTGIEPIEKLLLTREPSSCSCEVCTSLCKHSPCFPTPWEAKNIIDAGHKDLLYPSLFFDITTSKQYIAVAPKFENGACAFLDENDSCTLHAAGLKPLEGRLATHDRGDEGMRAAICTSWISKAGVRVLQLFSHVAD